MRSGEDENIDKMYRSMLVTGTHASSQECPFSSRDSDTAIHFSNAEKRLTIIDSKHRHLKASVTWKNCSVSA